MSAALPFPYKPSRVASHLGCAFAEGEVKYGALVDGTLGPDPAAMPVDDAPHGGEPDASIWERNRSTDLLAKDTEESHDGHPIGEDDQLAAKAKRIQKGYCEGGLHLLPPVSSARHAEPESVGTGVPGPWSTTSIRTNAYPSQLYYTYLSTSKYIKK